MSKAISNAQLKRNLTGKPDQIALMMRALPLMIQTEIDNPHPAGTSPKVIKRLKKTLDMVTKMQMDMTKCDIVNRLAQDNNIPTIQLKFEG